jgi:phospholipase A1/A2
MNLLRPACRLLAAAWLIASPWAQAQAQSSAADCVNIDDDKARLACYDRVHGRAAVQAHAVIVPAAPASAPPPAAPPPSDTPRLARRWDLDGQKGPGLFVPRAYRPVYVLPATWTDRSNRRPTSPAPEHSVTEPLELRPIEAKYQLSLKAKLADNLLGTPAALWGGYTQSSRWQVYNGADSRPFRETNYEPELMLTWPLNVDLAGWRLRVASLSLNHQSNGRALPLSRSWNRVIGALAFERGDWVAEFRPWWRIPESRSDDDNPDISDQLGRAELLLSRFTGDHAFNLQLRHSLRGGSKSKGSAQFEWVFPIDGALHGYLQWFAGKGESLIDYNLKQNRFGFGITIAGWQ